MYREIKTQLEATSGMPIFLMTDKIANVDALLRHEYVRKAQPFNPGQRPDDQVPEYEADFESGSVDVEVGDDGGSIDITGPTFGGGPTAEDAPGDKS